MTHALFEPLQLRNVTFRNRLWVPPMCMYQVDQEDGVPGNWHLMHLGALAQGGFGSVIVEATAVVPEGRISPNDLGLWDNRQRDAFKPITELMTSLGSVPGIQLAHAGRKASTWGEWRSEQRGSVPLDEGGWNTVGPSALPFPGLAGPTALSVEQIDRVVDAFTAAARRAVDAGFKLIELHGAHGYLIHEFLSPLSNDRTDDYGGSLENRSRLALRITESVRAEIGPDVVLAIRLSATDWVPGGWSVEETITLVNWLKQRGMDLISVSTGGNVADATMPIGPGYQVPFATKIRESCALPVATAGLIVEPAQAEQIVSLGQADVALIGREALRNPRFPLKAAAEQRIRLPYAPIQYRRAH